MTIERNKQTIELTRQELFEAHEEYEYITAKEILTERLNTRFGADTTSDVLIEKAIDVYLDDKQCGCEEDLCIEDAMDAVQANIGV